MTDKPLKKHVGINKEVFVKIDKLLFSMDVL